MRRIALALEQAKVRVGEETRAVYCREQIVTLTDHWRAQNTSSFGNQTQTADEIEFQRVSCSPQCDRQMTQMQPEAPFALTENSPEVLQIGLANSLCNGATGMLRCTVSPELTHVPFPQSSISKLELAKNLLRSQSTLVLSPGEANLGVHNFSNKVSPAHAIKAKTEAARLLGQNVQCIQLPMETMSTQQLADGEVLARLLGYTSLEVSHKTIFGSFSFGLMP